MIELAQSYLERIDSYIDSIENQQIFTVIQLNAKVGLATLEAKKRYRGNTDLHEKKDYETKVKYIEDTLRIQDKTLKQWIKKARGEREMVTEVISDYKKTQSYDEELLIRDQSMGLRGLSHYQPDRQIGGPFLKLPDKGTVNDEDPCCAICTIF